MRPPRTDCNASAAGCPTPHSLAPPPAPCAAQVRLYDVLFKSESPDALGDAWLADLNQDSLQVVQGAMVTPHLAQAKVRGPGGAGREGIVGWVWAASAAARCYGCKGLCQGAPG